MHEPKNLYFEYETHIASSDDTISLWVAEPQTSKTQKIINWDSSLVPSSKYTDDNGNKISYYEFKNENTIDLRITLTTTLWKRKFEHESNKSNEALPRGDRVFYTREETFLEQTPFIKQLANELTQGVIDPIKKISIFFNYTKENFSYIYPVENRGVSHLHLSNLQGDCAEYAGFFVALCRSVGVPARNITGYVINEQQPSEHGWASVYIDAAGWVDLDPQYASIEQNVNYFLETPDYRLAFIKGFNIPLSPHIPNDFSFQYWIKQGLPVTHASSQILQPLVFASKKECSFTEKYNVRVLPRLAH